MAENEFNWEGITGAAVRRLRAEKTAHVPAEIVRLAQRSYDGTPDPDNEGEKLHIHEFDFGDNVSKAEAFAKHMKNAGKHTTPMSSVTVKINPDKDSGVDKPGLVRWRAGARRGKAGAAESNAAA